MNYILSLILCLLLIPNITLSQFTSGTAIYSFSTISDISFGSGMIKDIMDNMSIDKSPALVSVTFNDGTSINQYLDENNHEISSPMDQSFASMHASLEKSCFDWEVGLTKTTESFQKKDYTVLKKYDSGKFKLIDTTASINGYECQLALELKHNYRDPKKPFRTEVWYSAIHKIPVGIKKYTGFPGMIIRVKSKTVQVDLIDITFSKVQMPDCPFNGDIISEEKFKSIKEDYWQSKRKN